MQRQKKKQFAYFQQVDFIFYNEAEIIEAVSRARLESGHFGGIVVVNSNAFTDPTARQAVKNLTPVAAVMIDGHTVKRPESWLEVVDKTYKWSKMQKDCRYEIARRRYSGEDYRKTCRDLNISNSMRRRLFEFVQMYATLQAVQLGLIQV